MSASSAAFSLLADLGDALRGGRLYGFAMAERERLKMPLTAQEARIYERDATCLRTKDADLFEAAQAIGRTLTVEEAFAIAQDLPIPPPDGTKPALLPI